MDNYLYVVQPSTPNQEEQVFGHIEYNDIARNTFEYEKVYRRKGDTVGYKISSNNRVGCFVVSGTTEKELLTKQLTVLQNMEVFDINNNPILRKDFY